MYFNLLAAGTLLRRYAGRTEFRLKTKNPLVRSRFNAPVKPAPKR